VISSSPENIAARSIISSPGGIFSSRWGGGGSSKIWHLRAGYPASNLKRFFEAGCHQENIYKYACELSQLTSLHNKRKYTNTRPPHTHHTRSHAWPLTRTRARATQKCSALSLSHRFCAEETTTRPPAQCPVIYIGHRFPPRSRTHWRLTGGVLTRTRIRISGTPPLPLPTTNNQQTYRQPCDR